MNKQYDDEKRGVLFVNPKKNRNDPEDGKPNFKGNIQINGVKYSLSAWTRPYIDKKDGIEKKLISISATHPDDMEKFKKVESPLEDNNDIPW